MTELAAMVAAAIAAAGLGSEAPAVPVEIVGTPIRRELDGVSDDLLTAGLGAEGLRGAPSPIRGIPRRRNCGAWPCTPPTAAWWT